MCISDYIQTKFFYLGRFPKKLADDQCSSITKKAVSTISNIREYPHNLLPWKWIDLKLDVKWKYLLYLIFSHTTILLCVAEL